MDKALAPPKSPDLQGTEALQAWCFIPGKPSFCNIPFPRPLSCCGWSLPSMSIAQGGRLKVPALPQLTPGPRFVIKWATDDTFASLKADQATSQRSSDPQMEQRKLLKAHALTDLAEHVASLPASGFSFDWGGINLSSYIYWPELSWSTLGTRDCISHGSEDQVMLIYW